MTVSTDTQLCSCARKIRSSSMRCIDSRTLIFPYKKKKHSGAESISTSAKLCVPMNMIGAQQRSIAHFWWKSTLRCLCQ
ncbi:hypothetical protein SFRURICE_001766 [Spodoptera frugiperda]|nr:hypothetical protein SFRURICE_001766 [Spodoptera frugiperda]